MEVDYKPFVDRVINKYEGGYSWNRKDPGGPTNLGVTCYDLAEHRGQKMTSMAKWAPLVQKVTLTEAEEIYAKKYAHGVRFNDLRAGVDCCVFDYAVNSGVSRAIKVAAALVKRKDTVVSDELVKAINKTDPEWFITAMCDERLRFMHAIRNGAAWVEFGRGWQARVNDLRHYCNLLDAGGTHAHAPPAPDLTRVVTPKAIHPKSTAGGVTAGGTVGGAAAAHAAGLSWWGVAATTGTIIAAGIVYEALSERAANKANALVHI